MQSVFQKAKAREKRIFYWEISGPRVKKFIAFFFRQALNRLRHGKPIPKEFLRDNEVVPLTELFEDISINRLALGERFYELFRELARLTLELAKTARSDANEWDKCQAPIFEIQQDIREAAEKAFHLSKISFED